MSHPLYARDRETGTMVELEAESLGGGKYGLAVAAGGSVTQAIPDYETNAEIVAAWEGFSGVDTANGDFVTAVPGLNGQAITVLSASPLTVGESVVVNVSNPVQQPCTMEFAGSFVRTGVSFATASLFANESITGLALADPVPAPINIVSAYQSNAVLGAAYSAVAGTVMHMVLESALPAAGSNQGVYAGDWINITGFVDTRLNYQSACVNYISPDRKTIAVGFSNEAALPSLAIATVTPTLGTAKCNFYNNMSGARNGFGLRFTGTVATSAAIVSIFGGDDNQVSGALLGDHRVTVGTSAPNYVAGAAWGQYEIRASTRYMLECGIGASVVLGKAEQTHAQFSPYDTPRTSVKPASGAKLYPRFRLYKPIGMSRPVAQILSAVKATASTTATINVVAAPETPLAVGNVVQLYGIRDQVNFPAATVTIASVITPTQFTAIIGPAVIATSYGGSVTIVNGGAGQPGIIGQTIQSVQSRVAEGANWLDVVGNATWTGMAPGDYVNLYGVRNSTDGGDVGVGGVWELAHLSTTTAVFKPVFDIAGNRLSPALGTLALTNCGGTVILRPTLRSHDLMLESRGGEQVVRIDGQGQLRADKVIGIYGMGGTITATANTTETTLIAPANYNLATTAAVNLANIKAAAGTLFFGTVFNSSAAPIFVKLYNKATAPVVATDAPIVVYQVAAGQTLPLDFGRTGRRFATGISLAITGAVGDTDATVIAAGCKVNFDYI